MTSSSSSVFVPVEIAQLEQEKRVLEQENAELRAEVQQLKRAALKDAEEVLTGNELSRLQRYAQETSDWEKIAFIATNRLAELVPDKTAPDIRAEIKREAGIPLFPRSPRAGVPIRPRSPPQDGAGAEGGDRAAPQDGAGAEGGDRASPPQDGAGPLLSLVGQPLTSTPETEEF